MHLWGRGLGWGRDPGNLSCAEGPVSQGRDPQGQGPPTPRGPTFWAWPWGTGSLLVLGQGMIPGQGAGWQGQTDRWTASPEKNPVAPCPGPSGATAENTEPLVWSGYCVSQPRSQKPRDRQVFKGA